MPRLHFVQELPVGSTRRDKELERAKARAHAASVSYQSHHHPVKPQPPARPDNNVQRLQPDEQQYQTTAGEPSASFAYGPALAVDPLFANAGIAQHGLHTPPDSPERRERLINQPFPPQALQAFETLAPSEEQSPPEAAWPENLNDDGHLDAEHVEDVSVDTNYAPFNLSSSAQSTALISTTPSHTVYQINLHAQYASASHLPWSHDTSTNTMPFDINLNTIPHDLLGTRRDPFDCIPHRHADTASVSAVTDYHAQIMAPNHAPIYKIFNVTNVYTSYYFELLSHPDFLYTGVASVQAIIDHLRRKPEEPVGPSKTVMKHIGTAMGRLRQRLGRLQKEARDREIDKIRRQQDPAAASTDMMDDVFYASQQPNSARMPPSTRNPTLQVDDMTIMTVLFLAVVTRAINDLESHEIHKRTIASLVAARGGLSNLTGHDGLARCTLMQWESFWALNTGVTIFPDARPPYAPRYPTREDVEGSGDLGQKVVTLPAGFQALSRHKRLALDVIEVLSRTARAHINQALHGTIVTPSDVFRTKPRKFQDFWEACTCLGAPEEVYSYESSSSNVGEEEEGVEPATLAMPNLEKLIVLALLLYCLHTFSPMRAVTAVYNGSRLKLTTDLPRRTKRPARPTVPADRELVADEEAVLLWAYLNLADSWRAADDSLLPQGRAIMRDIRARFPESTASWAACTAVLERFFWNKPFLTRCAAFWRWSEQDRATARARREDG